MLSFLKLNAMSTNMKPAYFPLVTLHHLIFKTTRRESVCVNQIRLRRKLQLRQFVPTSLFRRNAGSSFSIGSLQSCRFSTSCMGHFEEGGVVF